MLDEQDLDAHRIHCGDEMLGKYEDLISVDREVHIGPVDQL